MNINYISYKEINLEKDNLLGAIPYVDNDMSPNKWIVK